MLELATISTRVMIVLLTKQDVNSNMSKRNYAFLAKSANQTFVNTDIFDVKKNCESFQTKYQAINLKIALQFLV